jgi:hypothetical protein
MTELLDAAFAVLRSDPKAAALLLVLPQCALSVFYGIVEAEGIAVRYAAGFAGAMVFSISSFVVCLLWVGRLLGGRPTWREAGAGTLRRAPTLVIAVAAYVALYYAGLFLFWIPAVYLQLVLFVPGEVLAFERVGWLRSFARSRTLMAGSKRRVALPVLANFVFRTFLGFPVGPELRTVAVIVDALVGAYFSALCFVTYVDTRARKEAFDLEILAARVAARTRHAEDSSPAGRQAPGPGGSP